MSEKRILLTVLAIDDTPSSLALISEAISHDGIRVITAGNADEGLRLFQSVRPRVVLLDLVMPGVKGMELLDRMIAADSAADIILMTGHYSTESAVEAIQKGACDYLTKPLDLARLRERILGLLHDADERQRALKLESALVDTYQFEGIIGRSPLMLDVFAKIRRVALHFQTILVTGATGTGKELVARALHRLSPRASAPLVVCNCSALVETLLESELFGHVKGAFTGAVQDKIGVFEHANQGTVFLDEIGELPLAAQAKLLRVLQQREIQRVGSPATRRVDVRVIGATNRPLRMMVGEGKFREDLYYRLSMVEIALPRLAERKEDLPILQRYFVQKFAAQYGKALVGITRRAQVRLARYHWPGNVRELENVIGNAAMMVEGNVIDLKDLPDISDSAAAGSLDEEDCLVPMEEAQRRHLMRVLERVGGNKARAADILGISRSTIYEMLSKMSENRYSAEDTIKVPFSSFSNGVGLKRN